jgi:hypothetical protein
VVAGGNVATTAVMSAVTPKGVEHKHAQSKLNSAVAVMSAVTPKGVEHV